MAISLFSSSIKVRRSACRALQTPTVLSAEFSFGTVDILISMLNDDSVVVRLQALETLHHMATHDHLKVTESHLHVVNSRSDLQYNSGALLFRKRYIETNWNLTRQPICSNMKLYI